MSRLLPVSSTVALGVALGAALGAAAPAAYAQTPVAVAEERVDIDGDGAIDVIRIERPAAVSVSITGKPAAGTWKPLATTGAPIRGTITVGSGAGYQGRVAIVAEAVFGDRGRREVREAVVLIWYRGALSILWQGRVGNRGRDGEYAVRVEAGARGLSRYQHRADVYRCDGQDAYLFPERYDFASDRFRPVYNAVRVDPAAPVLTATRRAPAGAPVTAPGAVFRAASASASIDAGDAGELSAPREVDDGDPATAWREGLGGDGRGEFLTATATLPDPPVVAIRVIPGDASSPAAFRRANRLRRAALVVGERAFWVEFPRDPARGGEPAAPWWIALPEPVPARCVSLVIADTYPGSEARGPRTGTTAIADFVALTALDLAPGGPDAALAARVADGPDARGAALLLRSRGPAAIAAVLAEIARPSRTSAQKRALRRVLAGAAARLGDGGDPAAALGDAAIADAMAAQLAAGLAAAPDAAPSRTNGGGDGRADREVFADALARLGGEAASRALAALIADDAALVAARESAARALGGVRHPDAQAALIAAAGRGPTRVRRAIAVALGRRPASEFAALREATARATAASQAAQSAADASAAARAEADLWRAVGLALRRGGDAQREQREQIAEPLAARLRGARGYELRYRLFAVAGASPDPRVLAALDAAVSEIRTGADASSGEANALRRIAAGALGRNPVSESRTLLLTLMDDADPGVRLAATSSLDQHQRGDARTDRALTARLAGDRWPRIRALAATALGHRCGTRATGSTAGAATADAALNAAIDGDDDVDVRRAALGSLVSCRAPGIAERLVAVARDAKYPTPLRVRAIGLMVELGAPMTAPLLALFASLRADAWSKPEALTLGAAAAVALGRIGGDAVVDPLYEAAREPAFPELQAAAVTGLGELCPPRALPLLSELARSNQRAVAIAARAARDACAR